MGKRQARRIAARWALQEAKQGWQPPIPGEALSYFTRLAYFPDTPDLQALDEARDSVGALIPRVLGLLRKSQGDRYAVNGSESHGKIFWFFAPPQPIDAFSLTLSIRGRLAFLSFGYIPYTLAGQLDFRRMISDHATADPELAGLALMRIVRSILSKIIK